MEYIKYEGLSESTEIRKLPNRSISILGNILQIGYVWKDVMGLIPGHPWVPGQPLPEGTLFLRKYTSEDISLVANECSRDGRTGFEVIIEEWGTTGKIRPKIGDLIGLFEKAELERASIYLKNLIYENPERETEISGLVNEMHSQKCIDPNDPSEVADSVNIDVPSEQLEICIPAIPFPQLMAAVKAGTKIGEGAFGTVYKAQLSQNNALRTVAIKILGNIGQSSELLIHKEKLFQNEVKILSQCVHKNIITLEGYSHFKNELGLVYSFMENGSLFDRISCLDSTPPLPWMLRLSIAEGTADGIVYLHTKFSPPMVHRDIKSPNILLDSNFTPKIGDFGIVRLGGQGKHTDTIVNTTAIGTQMYMAPEAFRGDVSVKMDTFSYGIVILELLTGLLYFDEERENRDLLSHVQDKEGEELTLLDWSAGNWNTEVAKELFAFAEKCTREKRERPHMSTALNMLIDIIRKC